MVAAGSRWWPEVRWTSWSLVCHCFAVSWYEIVQVPPQRTVSVPVCAHLIKLMCIYDTCTCRAGRFISTCPTACLTVGLLIYSSHERCHRELAAEVRWEHCHRELAGGRGKEGDGGKGAADIKSSNFHRAAGEKPTSALTPYFLPPKPHSFGHLICRGGFRHPPGNQT